METIVKTLPGINGSRVPLVTLKDLPWPAETVADFEPYCGAGDGLFNALVPEKIWGIPISPACFIHDEMWALAEPSWQDFHYSNSVFRNNLDSLLREQSRSRFLYHLRLYRSVTFFNAVNTIGAAVFWGMKGIKPSDTI